MFVFHGYRDDGGGLHACWDGGLCQLQLEDGGEDLRELVRTGSECFPGVPSLSGPAAFLGFTPLSLHFTCCICNVRGW